MPPVRWSLWVLLRWVMEGSSPGVGSRRAALSAAGSPAWSGPAAAAKEELARHDVVQSSVRVQRQGPWSHPSCRSPGLTRSPDVPRNVRVPAGPAATADDVMFGG